MKLIKQFKLEIDQSSFLVTEAEAFSLYQQLCEHFCHTTPTKMPEIWDSATIQKAMKEGPSCG